MQVPVEQSATQWLTCQVSQPCRATVYPPPTFRPVA